MLNLYDSTEGGVISYRTDNSNEPTDLGEIIPEVKVEIVDDIHRPLKENVIGKIRIKSDQISTEYFNDSEATENHYKDGWFIPGI